MDIESAIITSMEVDTTIAKDKPPVAGGLPESSTLIGSNTETDAFVEMVSESS